MRRFWWWFRLSVLSIMLIGLGIYLFAQFPWLRWLGWAPHDYSAIIADGDRIIVAVEQFKAEQGLWPQYLDDLVPLYLQAPPDRRWFYDLSPLLDEDGHSRTLPALSTRIPSGPRAHVGYDFDPDQPGWRLFGDIEGVGAEGLVLRLGGPAIPNSPRPAISQEQRVDNQLAELDRRIQREQGDVEHWRGKAGLLIALGRIAEAREVVEAAQSALPASYWPRMANAAFELPPLASLPNPADTAPATQPNSPAGIEAFAQWVEAGGGGGGVAGWAGGGGGGGAGDNSRSRMTRLYYLSVLYRLAGDDQRAADAIAQALQQPIEVGPDDPNIAPYYLWDMARWALTQKRWELAIIACDAWELAEKESRLDEGSYRPLRAAAHLALGNLAGASADMAALSEKRIWAKNIDEAVPPDRGLRNAIERNDRAYRYHPGNTPAPFQIFPVPE